MEPSVKRHLLFRSIWWISDMLLVAALVATAWTGVREISLGRYLGGFSDAIIPEASTAQQKAQAILAWMQNGPPRFKNPDPAERSPHDPEDTLALGWLAGHHLEAPRLHLRSNLGRARAPVLATPEIK